MEWDLSGVAVGTKGTYRVYPENPEGGSPYYVDVQLRGFTDWRRVLEDPSRVNAMSRADQFDAIPT